MGKIGLLELLRIRFPAKEERELFAAVLRGDVAVAGVKIVKPGALVSSGAEVSLRESRRFVSRGGGKLDHALALWEYQVAGKVFIDAGCSTGGFTDCLLQRGAARVHCVDVGRSLLDWKIRSDPRVEVHDQMNVMALSPSDLSPRPDIAVVDLSFRSLKRAARHILSLTREGSGVFLVKPQFEWKDPPPEFHGVVKDTDRIRAILDGLIQSLAQEEVIPLKAVQSPVPGKKGNREFLFLFSCSGSGTDSPAEILDGLFLERLTGQGDVDTDAL
jgi:23S rRNA (cytidine1920-2'-O)/16S rRNA (cytidine1409-2'-O)-methyltransferase